jgi:hypothetical protein
MKDIDTNIRQILENSYPQTLVNNIMDEMSILDKHGIKDYLETISEIVDTDDVDHDPLVRADKIKNTIREAVYDYLNQRGIIISDIPHMVSDYKLYLILLAMEKLLDMDINEALFVLTVVNDGNIANNVDKLYYILNYLNPVINSEDVHTLADDVYDDMIDKLRKAAEDIVSKSNIEVSDADGLKQYLENMLDYLIDKKYESAPEIITSLILDPDTFVVVNYNIDKMYSDTVKQISILAKELDPENKEMYNMLLNTIDSLLLNLLIGMYVAYTDCDANISEEFKLKIKELEEYLENNNLNDSLEVFENHIVNFDNIEFYGNIAKIKEIMNLCKGPDDEDESE